MPNPGHHTFLPGLDLNASFPRVSWAGAGAGTYGPKVAPGTPLWMDEGVDTGILGRV